MGLPRACNLTVHSDGRLCVPRSVTHDAFGGDVPLRVRIEGKILELTPYRGKVEAGPARTAHTPDGPVYLPSKTGKILIPVGCPGEKLRAQVQRGKVLVNVPRNDASQLLLTMLQDQDEKDAEMSHKGPRDASASIKRYGNALRRRWPAPPTVHIGVRDDQSRTSVPTHRRARFVLEMRTADGQRRLLDAKGRTIADPHKTKVAYHRSYRTAWLLAYNVAGSPRPADEPPPRNPPWRALAQPKEMPKEPATGKPSLPPPPEETSHSPLDDLPALPPPEDFVFAPSPEEEAKAAYTVVTKHIDRAKRERRPLNCRGEAIPVELTSEAARRMLGKKIAASGWQASFDDRGVVVQRPS